VLPVGLTLAFLRGEETPWPPERSSDMLPQTHGMQKTEGLADLMQGHGRAINARDPPQRDFGGGQHHGERNGQRGQKSE